MEIGGIFSAILVGLLVGALGRLIVPGRQAIGWILTIFIGLVGAFVGGYLANGVNVDVFWQVLIFQVVVAAVLVLLVSSLIRSSAKSKSR